MLVWGGLFAVLVVVLFLPQAATQTCSSNYQLTAASFDYYSLVGVTGQFANGTVASVTGFLTSYNGTGQYRGVIYVQLLQTSSTTYSYYSVTVVEVSGNSTQTYTSSPSHPPGLQQITVAGNITNYQVCVRPVPEFNKGTVGLLAVTAILLALFLVSRKHVN